MECGETAKICRTARLGFATSVKNIGADEMNLTIVDTDILIDVARGNDDAIDCLLRFEKSSTLAISAVTQMQLLIGCRNKRELKDLEKF